jgi:hypothetical protein
MNNSIKTSILLVVMSLLMFASPIAVSASHGPGGGGGVASGCPSLSGAEKQPMSSTLTYTDSGGSFGLQTAASKDSIIAICVYPQGGISGYALTTDSSISSKWSVKTENDHFIWGRIKGIDTLPIDGSTYSIGTMSPNPTITLVLAHIQAPACTSGKGWDDTENTGCCTSGKGWDSTDDGSCCPTSSGGKSWDSIIGADDDKNSNTCFVQVPEFQLVTPLFPYGTVLGIVAPLAAFGSYIVAKKRSLF